MNQEIQEKEITQEPVPETLPSVEPSVPVEPEINDIGELQQPEVAAAAI